MNKDISTSTISTENGVTFKNFTCNKQVDALAVLPNKRIVMTGTPSIAIMSGSWKFGKQIQFQLTTPKDTTPLIEERNNYSKYNRIEIDLPYEQGKQMIIEAYNELMKVPKPKTDTRIFYLCFKCKELHFHEIVDKKLKCTKCGSVRDKL